MASKKEEVLVKHPSAVLVISIENGITDYIVSLSDDEDCILGQGTSEQGAWESAWEWVFGDADDEDFEDEDNEEDEEDPEGD